MNVPRSTKGGRAFGCLDVFIFLPCGRKYITTVHVTSVQGDLIDAQPVLRSLWRPAGGDSPEGSVIVWKLVRK